MAKYEPHRFPWKWNLLDGYPAKGIEPHNSLVFGTFACGGGSSMGYKLAGFHHLGGVEIDQKVAETYKLNHHPELFFTEDLRDFNKRTDLPDILYHLDMLDGSPPCTTFSTAGNRDKVWGKEKHFAEGQKMQTLDDLVFVYCDTILKLRPKCFLLENVSGLIKGNAKSYAKRIVDYLTENGYTVQLFLLNAATMGVPQRRERTFFVGHKSEYHLPKLKLNFNEKPITFSEVEDKEGEHPILTTEYTENIWKNRKYGDCDFGNVTKRLYGKVSGFTRTFLYRNQVVPTFTTYVKNTVLFHKPCRINETEIKSISTFPQDYQSPTKDIGWLCGMSVPPVMMAQVSYQIYLQWIKKINSNNNG